MSKNKQMSENILSLVAAYPHIKDNYNLLITYYWKYVEEANDFNGVDSLSSAESITRKFRQLVKNGAIHLSDKSKRIRADKEIEYRNTYSRKIG